jgi:predicted nucleic acid-binding protein
LAAPESLWSEATLLGQQCIDRGIQPRSLDLLIALICLHHHAELVTFDGHFRQIAKVASLNVRLLERAA